jgi:hypothetical protein
MNADDQELLETDRMKKLLQQVLPPVNGDQGTERDLWPDVLRRMDAGPARAVSGWAWFDMALLAGLVGVAALFPTAIPVLLYYL